MSSYLGEKMPTRNKGDWEEIEEESDEPALKDVIISQFSKIKEELVEFKHDIITKLDKKLLAIERNQVGINWENECAIQKRVWGKKEGGGRRR